MLGEGLTGAIGACWLAAGAGAGCCGGLGEPWGATDA